jgi:hypothetical protein
MTGIQGQDVAADLEALTPTKESVDLDLVIRTALDVESVPRELARGSESKDNHCRYHCVQALLQFSYEVRPLLLLECVGAPPTLVPTVGESSCAYAPVQPLKAAGALRTVGDRRLARGRSPSPHTGWG